MHYKALAFHALIALGVAESLTDAINEFPSCSIKCLSDNVADKGCQLTDFNCICKEQVSLAVKLGICTGASCTGTFSGFDVGKALGELCGRWVEDPSSTEVAAATSTLAALASGAATATSSSTAGTPTSTKNAAVIQDTGMRLFGAAAAVVAVVLV